MKSVVLCCLVAPLVLLACESSPAPVERHDRVVRTDLELPATRPILPPGHQPVPVRFTPPVSHGSVRRPVDGMRMEVYDVRDLVAPRAGFVAPVIRGLPTSDDEEPRFGREEDASEPFVQPDHLVMIVQEATDPVYWVDTEGASIEVTERGLMIVRAHDSIHRRIGTGLGARR